MALKRQIYKGMELGIARIYNFKMATSTMRGPRSRMAQAALLPAALFSAPAWVLASQLAVVKAPGSRKVDPRRAIAIEAELTEKSLPETSAWEPIAGYLYFSVPKKKKGGYEL